MIVDFGVKNFRSIRDLETLAMNAAKIVSKDKELDTRNLILVSDKLSLLKTKAIYGANASGKSTMISALSIFIQIVVNSVKEERLLPGLIQPYILGKERDEPTYFQLSFIYRDTFYRYGFEASVRKIESEWLFGTPGKKEVALFTRKGSEIYVNEKQFPEGSRVKDLFKQQDNDIARENSLLLSVARSYGQGLARDLLSEISSYIVVPGLSDERMHFMAERSIEESAKRQKMADWLKMADTGIEDIMRVEKEIEGVKGSPAEFMTLTVHRGFDKDGKPDRYAAFHMQAQESEGTKKMFEIGPALFQALEEGRVLIMDEFDARLHPLLSRKIVELFNTVANKSAQFIYATHDTNLLSAELLRRDQICFVEKDKHGASHFYSLADFKGVRNDASYEKDYIAGRYGAIPFLGDFQSLLEK
jgi:AAA15 family ATPase/GTPase